MKPIRYGSRSLLVFLLYLVWLKILHDMDDGMINLLFILLAILLILLNAFFVAAEFALVKLRQTQVQAIMHTRGLAGRILNELHTHLDAYLSACQLGITLASLGLGWVGEPAFATLLAPIWRIFAITNPEVIEILAFFFAFSLISFLHIVIGELMPKSLAIRRPEMISLWTAVPLYLFYWLMFPAIWLLNTCAKRLLQLVGLHAETGESFYSTEEIKLILGASYLHGELTQEETEIIKHTLEFADLRVTEVMRPSEAMVVLDVQKSTDSLLNEALRNRYSRYPVYDSKTDKIIGIIHVKDLFAALYQQKAITHVQAYIRPILKVSHFLPALDLLKEFREGMPHFALVYKGVDLLGFVTLDNLLQAVIGRIKDEFHITQEDWQKDADGSLLVSGDCSLYSLEKALNQKITLMPDETEVEVETLAGLLVARIGKLPTIGEQIDFPEFTAKVEEIRGTHLLKIRLNPKPPEQKLGQ